MINLQMLGNMLRSGGNPQQMLMNMLQQQMGNTPMSNNLMQMIQGNNTSGIEQMARNICKSKGIDADEMYNNIKKNMGM